MRQRSRVADGDALALHHVDAIAQDGEQQVGNAIVQQVDLVNVQDAAVRLRQQARLEHRLALLGGGVARGRAGAGGRVMGMVVGGWLVGGTGRLGGWRWAAMGLEAERGRSTPT